MKTDATKPPRHIVSLTISTEGGEQWSAAYSALSKLSDSVGPDGYSSVVLSSHLLEDESELVEDVRQVLDNSSLSSDEVDEILDFIRNAEG